MKTYKFKFDIGHKFLTVREIGWMNGEQTSKGSGGFSICEGLHIKTVCLSGRYALAKHKLCISQSYWAKYRDKM